MGCIIIIIGMVLIPVAAIAWARYAWNFVLYGNPSWLTVREAVAFPGLERTAPPTTGVGRQVWAIAEAVGHLEISLACALAAVLLVLLAVVLKALED